LTAPSRPRRHYAFAGTFGNFVEWYDFAIYGASAALLADVLTGGEERCLPTS